eukprot:1140433-Pelagomonas_calceolata.AAC.4
MAAQVGWVHSRSTQDNEHFGHVFKKLTGDIGAGVKEKEESCMRQHSKTLKCMVKGFGHLKCLCAWRHACLHEKTCEHGEILGCMMQCCVPCRAHELSRSGAMNAMQ